MLKSLSILILLLAGAPLAIASSPPNAEICAGTVSPNPSGIPICSVATTFAIPVATSQVLIKNAAGTLFEYVAYSAVPAGYFIDTDTNTANASPWWTIAAYQAALAAAAPTIPVATAVASAPVVVTWVNPTQNTDGSALTNLASINILKGASPTTLTLAANVPATPASYAFPALFAPGNYYVSAQAVNATGGVSADSGLVELTVTPAPVTPPPTPPPPAAPTKLVVTCNLPTTTTPTVMCSAVAQ